MRACVRACVGWRACTAQHRPSCLPLPGQAWEPASASTACTPSHVAHGIDFQRGGARGGGRCDTPVPYSPPIADEWARVTRVQTAVFFWFPCCVCERDHPLILFAIPLTPLRAPARTRHPCTNVIVGRCARWAAACECVPAWSCVQVGGWLVRKGWCLQAWPGFFRRLLGATL